MFKKIIEWIKNLFRKGSGEKIQLEASDGKIVFKQEVKKVRRKWSKKKWKARAKGWMQYESRKKNRMA